MNTSGTAYTIVFSAIICGICSIFVSGSAVGLKERQDFNAKLDKERKVLQAVGLADASTEPTQVTSLYAERVTAKVVNLAAGKAAEGVDVASFDQLKARKDPSTSSEPENDPAKVGRVPNNAKIYLVRGEKGGAVTKLVLPVEGKGLWSTLYGFLAMEVGDLNTIRGLIFYQHGETPGLGGEVDSARFRGAWKKGIKAFARGPGSEIKVKVLKAGTPISQPTHQVDGLSGATITTTGVSNTLQFWLGDEGFGPTLENFKVEFGADLVAAPAGTEGT